MPSKAQSKRTQLKPVQKQSPDAQGKSNIRLWLALATILAAYVLLRANIIHIPLDRDEGAFGYTGQLILDGGLPYKDAVDHKPPGVFYLYALALLFIPATEVGIHVFLHAYNFLTLVTLFLLMKIRFQSLSAALWAAFAYALFSASPAIQGFTASSEMFMLLPITLSLLFAVLGVNKGRLVFLLLSGVAGAAAFWIKQTALASVFFALLYTAAEAVRTCPDGEGNRWLHALKPVLSWAAGATIVSAAVVGYFYGKGIFAEFVYWSFTHNLSYAGRLPVPLYLKTLGSVWAEIVRGDFVVLGLGLAVPLWNASKKNANSYFLLGFFAFSLLGTLPGFAYPHYFAQLAPAVAAGAGWGLSGLLPAIKDAGRKLGASILCGALLAGVPLAAHKGYFWETPPAQLSREYFGDSPFAESRELAEFISSRTASSDTIFIFGSEPQILFYSHRKSATAFVMIYPLTSSYPRYREFQQRVWEEIGSKRPKYILLVNVPTSILWDGQANLQILRRLDDLIAATYSIEAVMTVDKPRGKLFVLDDPSAPPEEVAKSRTNIYIYLARSG